MYKYIQKIDIPSVKENDIFVVTTVLVVYLYKGLRDIIQLVKYSDNLITIVILILSISLSILLRSEIKINY